jgi:FHS family glucose/mannose:H+ symporter-like MFS transporter
MTTAAAPDVTFPRAFRAASFVGFLLLGAVVSLYGPAVPLFREQYGVSTSLAGMALPVNAAASVVGVIGWGALDRSGHVRTALLLGALSTGSGAATVALAPTFPVVLAGVVLVGLGFGIVDTGINAIFARDRSAGATRRMNMLHAMFGFGAVSFPLLLSFTSLTVAFLTAAMLMLAALPGLRHGFDPGVAEPEDDSPAARRSARFVLIGFLSIFALYIGIELGIGNWMAAHLTDEGWSAAAAARWTSGYFATFTLGRLLVARVAERVHPARIVISALGLGALFASAANLSAITPYAYLLAGLAIAPVFPTTMVWLSQRLPEQRHGPAAAMLAGSSGATVFPAAVGVLVGVTSTSVVPTAVAATGLAAMFAAIKVRRSARSG